MFAVATTLAFLTLDKPSTFNLKQFTGLKPIKASVLFQSMTVMLILAKKYPPETTKQDLAFLQRITGSFEYNAVLHINKQEIV